MADEEGIAFLCCSPDDAVRADALSTALSDRGIDCTVISRVEVGLDAADVVVVAFSRARLEDGSNRLRSISRTAAREGKLVLVRMDHDSGVFDAGVPWASLEGWDPGATADWRLDFVAELIRLHPPWAQERYSPEVLELRGQLLGRPVDGQVLHRLLDGPGIDLSSELFGDLFKPLHVDEVLARLATRVPSDHVIDQETLITRFSEVAESWPTSSPATAPDPSSTAAPRRRGPRRKRPTTEESPPAEPQREEVRLLADEPTTDDRLRRRGVARYVAFELSEIAKLHSQPTFLIHLDGPWGAGKSTLLELLDEEVRKIPGFDPLVVRFDAWRQSKAGAPWLTLLHALRRELGAASLRSRVRLWVRERLRLLGQAYAWAAASAAVFAFAVFVLAVFFWKGPDATRGEVLVKAATGVVAIAGAVWTAGKAASKVFSLDSKQGSDAFVMRQSDPMEALASHFTWLVCRAERPVLFYIDDLDRCDHGYVVELLDSVQKLLREKPSGRRRGRRPPVLVVVAADGRWLRQSYQLGHPGFADTVGTPGRPLGSLFLDKLFQLTVVVPTIAASDQQSLLRHFLDADEPRQEQTDAVLERRLNNATGSEVMDVLEHADQRQRLLLADDAIDRLLTPESRRQTEHALQAFCELLENNPRSMKRFVMAYGAQRAVTLAGGSAVPLAVLARWTVLVTRWPRLGEFLREDPDAVELFAGSDAETAAASVPADLLPLFAGRPARLMAVVGTGDARLKAEDIRECCGVPRPAVS